MSHRFSQKKKKIFLILFQLAKTVYSIRMGRRLEAVRACVARGTFWAYIRAILSLEN